MIYTKLMEHQKLICKFLIDKDYAAIFADYGTGKTLCSLMWIDRLKPEVRKILVVSSKTAILSTWPQEIIKHTNFRYVHLLGTYSQKMLALKMGLRKSYIPETPYAASKIEPIIFLINFDGVRTIYNELIQSDFNVLIVDESTKIKSPKALRTKVLWALSRYVDKRIIMTGFPITENLAEIYSQIKFLDFGKSLGNKYFPFLDRYFYKAGFKRVPRTGTEKKIFGLIKPFAIRVTNEVLKLPPQVYETKSVEPTNQQKKLLEQLKDFFSLELGKVKIDTQFIFTLINKSLQICDGFVQDNWYILGQDKIQCNSCKKSFDIDYKKKGHCPSCRHKGYREIIETAKDEMVMDLVEEIDPNKNKVIIWSVFRFTIKKLQKIFKKMGYNVLTLTGETENVDAVVKKFQNSKNYNILLATQKKAGESITLTACKYAIYYSNSWSYDLRANSEARIRRKGSEKHKSIIYTDIIVKNSIEKLVYDCLRKKKNLVNSLKNEFKNISMGEK